MAAVPIRGHRPPPRSEHLRAFTETEHSAFDLAIWIGALLVLGPLLFGLIG